MEIADSARKHGITDEEIRHAVQVPLRWIRQDVDPTRILVIGTDASGRLLEIVVMEPEGEPFVIHADALRPKFYDYLKG